MINRGKIYVEFVGQHTAGKTTIIRNIVDHRLLSPMTAMYPQIITRSHIHFALSLPLLGLRNIRHLGFIMGFFLCYARWHWTNYHAAGRHMWKMVLLHPYYQQFSFDVWMKDDLLHLLPRIEFRSGVNVEHVLGEFFNHFSHLYDGIVYVDLSYEEMKKRFPERFAGRSDRRRRNRAKVYERAYQQNVILKQVLEKQSNVPVLYINGTTPVRENAQQVVDFINTKIYE